LDFTAKDVLVKHDNVLSAAARQMSTNDINMK